MAQYSSSLFKDQMHSNKMMNIAAAERRRGVIMMYHTQTSIIPSLQRPLRFPLPQEALQ
jgi:hypothetical protein